MCVCVCARTNNQHTLYSYSSTYSLLANMYGANNIYACQCYITVCSLARIVCYIFKFDCICLYFFSLFCSFARSFARCLLFVFLFMRVPMRVYIYVSVVLCAIVQALFCFLLLLALMGLICVWLNCVCVCVRLRRRTPDTHTTRAR